MYFRTSLSVFWYDFVFSWYRPVIDAGYDKVFTILSSSEANPEGGTNATTHRCPNAGMGHSIRLHPRRTSLYEHNQVATNFQSPQFGHFGFYPLLHTIHCLHTGPITSLNLTGEMNIDHFPEFKVENFMFQLELDKNGYTI